MTEEEFIKIIQNSNFQNSVLECKLNPELTLNFTNFQQKINKVTTLDQLFNEMILYSSLVDNISYFSDCLNSCSGEDSPYSRFSIALLENTQY